MGRNGVIRKDRTKNGWNSLLLLNATLKHRNLEITFKTRVFTSPDIVLFSTLDNIYIIPT